MAKKEKRVSVNALEKIAKEHFNNIETEQWFGVDITIRRTLPLYEMMCFVQDAVDMCFTSDGTFIPEVLDFAVRIGLLTRYANFTLPNNLEKQYWLTYATDAVDVVGKHINTVQLHEMIQAINRKIEYMCDTDIISIKSKLDDLNSEFAKMGGQFSDMFRGIDASDVRRMIDVIGENGVDQKQIASAYIQYMKEHSKVESDDQ